jgi:hypothetical protein
MDFIAVRIQHERRDPNSQLQCLAGLCNISNQRLFEPKKPLVRQKEKSRVISGIFNCRYSVFFWQLLLLEQMTRETRQQMRQYPQPLELEAGLWVQQAFCFQGIEFLCRLGSWGLS